MSYILTQENFEDALKDRSKIHYPEDCQVIIREAAKVGIIMGRRQAQFFWEWYSEQQDAGWLNVRASEVVGALEYFITQRLAPS